MNDDSKSALGACGLVAGILFALVIVGILGSIGAAALGWITLPFFKFGAKVNMNQNMITKVYDADRCVSINKDFLTLKNSVPMIRDTQIPNAKAALKELEATLPADRTQWSITDKEQWGNKSTMVTGLEQQLADLQMQYTTLQQREDAQPCLGTLPLFIDLR